MPRQMHGHVQRQVQGQLHKHTQKQVPGQVQRQMQKQVQHVTQRGRTQCGMGMVKALSMRQASMGLRCGGWVGRLIAGRPCRRWTVIVVSLSVPFLLVGVCIFVMCMPSSARPYIYMRMHDS